MKNLYTRSLFSTLLLINLFTGFTSAQTTTTGTSTTTTTTTTTGTGTTVVPNANVNLNRKWNWGLNLGATWETSDSRNLAGFGWGLTLGKYYGWDGNGPFDFGFRFRYLRGNAYGQDYKRNTGLQYNSALNGTNPSDTSMNYLAHGGYVFNNYKMTSDELSFEIMIGAKKLRQSTGVLLYVFGGGGIYRSNTMMNMRDASGQLYDFSKVDSTGNQSLALANINSLLDNTYETAAQGSGPSLQSASWKFVPTLGIGIGHTIGMHKTGAIGFEYKVTFPMHDLLDGQQWTNANVKTGKNDYQNYAGFYLRWYFYGSGSSTTHTDANNYTYVPPTDAKPYIIINSPMNNPYNSPVPNATVLGSIQNIDSKNNVEVRINGMVTNNFSFDPINKSLSISTPLNPGTNLVDITATNTFGSDHKEQTLLYEHTETVTGPPPTVNITYPSGNPYHSISPNVNVTAVVENVAGQSNIYLNYNNQPVYNFSYNANTKVLNFSANLLAGTNILAISASNQYGSDAKSITMILDASQNPTVLKPIVTITYPQVNPYTTPASHTQITATVLNVASQNEISVTANGSPVNSFTYDSFSKILTYDCYMNNQSSVNVIITAANNAGSDSKSQMIIAPAQALPPSVIITTPNVNPYSTFNAMETIMGTVLNVASANEIHVTVNGSPVSNFFYNSGNNQLNFNANLIVGGNIIVVAANNQNGSDSKTETIIYNPGAQSPKPVVTITNPSTNPSSVSVSNQLINATVQYITASNQITVLFNNNLVNNFTYNPTSHQLSFSTVLMPGQNTVTITATNNSGSDSKSTVIDYIEKAPLKPMVTITNPAISPTTVNTSSQLINAMVLNVNSQNEINVFLNNNPVTNFVYDMNSKQLSFTATLNNGSNLVSITATNNSGSDSKSTTILYQPKIILNNNNLKPIVTITNPATNPYTAAQNTQAVNASIQYVTLASNVIVTLNNNSITNFAYNNGQLSFTANLNSGSNLVSITGTNTAGADTKTTTINYQPVVAPPAPIVTITSPTANPYNTTTAFVPVTFTVNNVNSPNEISVSVNNTPTGNFSYSMMTHILSLSTNAIAGNNTVTVSATNNAGSDSKTETIIYTAPVGLPPVVTFTYPMVNPYITSNPNITVLGTVLNVSGSGDITVKNLFGSPVPFTYDVNTKIISMPYVLTPNANIFNITATNQYGTDSKSETVKYETNSSNQGTNNGNQNNNNQNNNNNNNNQNPNNNNNSNYQNPNTINNSNGGGEKEKPKNPTTTTTPIKLSGKPETTTTPTTTPTTKPTTTPTKLPNVRPVSKPNIGNPKGGG